MNKIDKMGNIIDNTHTTEMIDDIVDYIANAVSQTFGPYGHNTLIQTLDNVQSTKDGWTVLQNITFKSPLYNTIKTMIANVAQSTVLLVGDGSTTSTIAANYMNKYMAKVKGSYTIRDLEDSLTRCVNTIVQKLKENAIEINDDNLEEAINKIALVSTNWNKELSDMITDIYVATHNPIIKIEKSGTDKTYTEFIEGFELSGSLMCSEFYAFNRENATCELKKPYIIIFNHNVTEKYFMSLCALSEICRHTGRTIVVIAPGFENGFISKLNATNMARVNSHQPLINMVPVKVVNYYTIDKECIDDFAALTTTMIVNATDDDFKDFLDEVSTTMYKSPTGDADADAALQASKQELAQMALGYMDNVFGTCEEIIIGEKSVLIKGLTNSNTELVDERKRAIQYEIDKKTREYDALSMLSDDIRMKRIRLGKLQCNMGVIRVGGYGAANIKAKTDALDDATRACEAAYRDGYTIGGSMAIIQAIDDIIIASSDGQSPIDCWIYTAIKMSFESVFKTLFINKYDSDDIPVDVDGIIKECLTRRVTYNIIDDDFDMDMNVINPVNVDIEVIKACLRLVLISVTSNQFIYKHYDFSDTSDLSMKEVE